MRALKDENPDINKKKCAILGSGGAARAVVIALARAEVDKICLLTRNMTKTEKILADIKNIFPDLNVVCKERDLFFEIASEIDLLVNATPAGMKLDDLPYIDSKCLSAKTFVYDLIYNPAETCLLKSARQKGCRTLNGLNMLLYQGVEAFRLWFNEEPPLDVMRKALEEAVYGNDN